MKKISKYELKKRLQILKNILNNYDKQNFYNISFINIEAFCSHLESYNNSPYKVFDIISSIDKYIPLKKLYDTDLMQNFYAGLNCNTIEEIKHFKTIFYKKAVLKFFYLITIAKTKKQWDEILNCCEDIRVLYNKEKSY